jgi:hypothetical protein
MLSYEVLDSEEAAKSVAPRPDATLIGFRAGDMRAGSCYRGGN